MCVHLYTTEYQDVKGQRLYPLAPISLLLGEGSRQFVQFESENVRYARFFFSERQTHQNAIQSLFERSEFLIDTSQKKSLRVCTCARVHVCNNLGFSVWYYVPHTYVPGISSLSAGCQDTYMYICARVGYVLCATYVRKLV